MNIVISRCNLVVKYEKEKDDKDRNGKYKRKNRRGNMKGKCEVRYLPKRVKFTIVKDVKWAK
jgi:hypothetical protein